MKTLLDCIDELCRIRSRAKLLELALTQTNEAGDGVYGEAIAQQAQDVAIHLDGLVAAFDAINQKARAR
ncbi:hypothetical protein LG047_15780 [Methylocystis sp. WRRC1]|uniref:hypothetical protein n=1 Tax=Methylocystis sp. WRRC1 TaxID=1732014 RepID=UPI001D13CE16|nr:hypothetical protein [Methylocystis sp. WRRC1]MCC3246759.1 hypothetical protein [Methylocystis sp. WRRC1]